MSDIICYPKNVYIELTRNCNLHCKMCRERGDYSSSYYRMSDKIISIIEEQILPFARVVDLRGYGESTLDNRFEKLVDRYIDWGLKVKFFTNLNTKNSKFWERIGKRDVQVGISIESAIPGRYEHFRRGGKYNKFIKNLNSFLKYDKARERCYFAVTIGDENILDLFSIVDLAIKFNIPRIFLNNLTKYTDDGSVQKYLDVKMNNYIHDSLVHILEKIEGKNVSILLTSSPLQNVKRINYYCIHPWTNVLICFNGDVKFCDCLDNIPESTIGNLLYQNFENIWNSEKYNNIRNSFKNGVTNISQNINQECGWCFVYRYGDFYDNRFRNHGPVDLRTYLNLAHKC